MFTEHFPTFITHRDRLTCTVDGFDCVAWTTYDDNDHTPPPDRDEGFWPSLNPDSAGYIGPKSPSTLRRRMARARDVLAAWENDEWDYCGVCVQVFRAGVPLTDRYAHVIWGVERNYPFPSRGKRRNAYLRDVANELLPEALDAARAKLAELTAATPSDFADREPDHNTPGGRAYAAKLAKVTP